jgi:hypothetical protein
MEALMKPRTWEFFLACHLVPINRQRGMHHYALHRDEKQRKQYLAAQLNVWCPKDAFVDGPHAPRHLDLLVIRARPVDDDALGPMCKPLIDVLKCLRRKVYGRQVITHHGVVWDDSRKFVRITFDQQTMASVGLGATEGVRVLLKEVLPIEKDNCCHFQD